MSEDATRLVQIILDTAEPPATPEMDQEQRVAVFELVDEHRFEVNGLSGDVALRVAPQAGAIRFTAEPQAEGAQPISFDLQTGPFTGLIRDYQSICAAYFDAVRRLPVNRIEALDEGRRAIHTAAGEQMVSAISPFAAIDAATGRRLFSLIATLG